MTLSELLLVIAIIGILATITLVAIRLITSDGMKEKTRTILAAVSKGLALASASRAGSISPVEHPLAGSRAPRFLFRRFNPPSDIGTGQVPAGAALDSVNVALTGLNLTSQLPGGSSSPAAADVMLPTDLYADQASPLLFGLKREYIGVLGALQKRVTKYILLPKPLQGQPSLLASSFPALTTAALPQDTIPTDVQDVDPSYGHPSANKQSIDYLFGSSSVQTELSALNALYMADPTTAANTSGGVALKDVDNAFRNPINPLRITSPASPPAGLSADTTLLALLYTDGKPVPTWQPGCVYVTGGTADYSGSNTQTFLLASGAGGGGGGMWVHYRLPGLAIYDAWKNEILYSISPQGGIRLMSAGNDGVFQYDPGINHVLDSSDPEGVPAGDDQDGAQDNVEQRVKEQN